MSDHSLPFSTNSSQWPWGVLIITPTNTCKCTTFSKLAFWMKSANVTIFCTRKKFRKQNMQTNHFNSNTSQNESAKYKKIELGVTKENIRNDILWWERCFKIVISSRQPRMECHFVEKRYLAEQCRGVMEQWTRQKVHFYCSNSCAFCRVVHRCDGVVQKGVN